VSNKTKFNIQLQSFILYSKSIDFTMIHWQSLYLYSLLIPNTLILFQSKWLHIDSSFSHNNNHIISTILKLISACVTMVPWFPFNPQYTGVISTKMITYEPITQSSHILHQFIILKHIDIYVTMVPWFPFNLQYTSFISTIMVTYKSIHHSSNITHQFHHTKVYKDICNHGTLVSFQPLVHWFHFNQNDYI